MSVYFTLTKIKNKRDKLGEIMSPHSSIRIQDRFSVYSELIEDKFQFIKEVICCPAVLIF